MQVFSPCFLTITTLYISYKILKKSTIIKELKKNATKNFNRNGSHQALVPKNKYVKTSNK